ncbi:MAG: hypothetical protein AAFQ47_08825 [Pseudomonadota bacterium]
MSYILLSEERAEKPSEESEFEFTLLWSAEIAIHDANLSLFHVVEEGLPDIYFKYITSETLGKRNDHYSLDLKELSDCYSQMVERVCEHVSLVASFFALVEAVKQAQAWVWLLTTNE